MSSFSSLENILFSSEQINFLCEVLCLWQDGKRLMNFFSVAPSITRLFHQVPTSKVPNENNELEQQRKANASAGTSSSASSSTSTATLLWKNMGPTVLKAHAFTLFYQQKYDELFKTLEENVFPEEDHPQLRELWYEARYAEDECRKQKKLGPVDKYRIRKKYNPPFSVWDGHEIVYSFKAPSRRLLKEFYMKQRYPNSEEKKQISMLTGLNIVQISNWFKNRRQRDKTSKEK